MEVGDGLPGDDAGGRIGRAGDQGEEPGVGADIEDAAGRSGHGGEARENIAFPARALPEQQVAQGIVGPEHVAQREPAGAHPERAEVRSAQVFEWNEPGVSRPSDGLAESGMAEQVAAETGLSQEFERQDTV